MDQYGEGQFLLMRRMQAGVVARVHLLEIGFTDNDIRRLKRQRVLTEVVRGVYVDHTGPLTWHQRAWAACLACWPAALWGESALRMSHGLRLDTTDDRTPIHIGMQHRRSLTSVPHGVVPHRPVGFDRQVRWTPGPPRQRTPDAVVDVAITAPTTLDTVAAIADAVGGRLATAAQLAGALAARSRVADRRFLIGVIDDVGRGTCSVLEHGYLTLVERPHGLPTADRQFAESLHGPLFRDAVYGRYGVVVELDGRMHHTRTASFDADLERDLDALLTARVSARLGWAQVFDRACTTASKVGVLLNQRGWPDPMARCPRCPPAGGLSVTR